jgi:proteasome accessory factor PafA2
MSMSRLFGLETEYGILVDGKGADALMEEARAVVRAYAGRHAGPWDYRVEDPRRDMRGFRVEQLSYNPEDARYDRQSGPPLTSEEQRADRVLANGARLYNDHGHPEYATPECRTLYDLVAHDRAGERIVLACARARSPEGSVRIFKNNTDFHGMSYGCHEGYLIRRDVPVEALIAGLLPFFVTRQIYAGAGKVGVEGGGPFADRCVFQLSQRADFFDVEASVDTLHRRPIVNTRDEPHATPHAYRRVHVIVGDANMSEFATALKVGTTQAVLELIQSGWEPFFRLRDPVLAIKEVSRDPSFRWLVTLADGQTISAVELQRIYLRDAKRLLAGADPETDWVLREWEAVLDALEKDPGTLADRVDWVAKRDLLQQFREAEERDWRDDALRSLDLAYHDVDPEAGLYHALEQAGAVQRVVDDAAIERAMVEPPADTRAFLRGLCVTRYAPHIQRIGWARVGLGDGAHTHWLDLHELVDGQVAALNERAAATKSLEELIQVIRGARL